MAAKEQRSRPVAINKVASPTHQLGQDEDVDCFGQAALQIRWLILIALYLMVVLPDFSLACIFFRWKTSEPNYESYFVLTLLLLVLPAPVLSVYSAIEYKRERKTDLPDKSKWRSILRGFCVILCLTRVLRILAECIYGLLYLWAKFTDNKSNMELYRKLWRKEIRLNKNLLLIEVFIRSGLLLPLQLFVICKVRLDWKTAFNQFFSVLTSIACLAWAFASSGSLFNSLNQARKAEEHTCLGTIFLFLAHLLTLLPRILLMTVMTVLLIGKWELLIWALYGAHVLVMFLWFYFTERPKPFGDMFIQLLRATISLFSYIPNCDRIGLRFFYWTVCFFESTAFYIVWWCIDNIPFNTSFSRQNNSSTQAVAAKGELSFQKDFINKVNQTTPISNVVKYGTAGFFENVVSVAALSVMSVSLFIGFHLLRRKLKLIVQRVSRETIKRPPATHQLQVVKASTQSKRSS